MEPIWGIEYKGDEPLELGINKIYHKAFHQNQLVQYGHTKDARPENSFWQHLKSLHVIETSVIASDQQEAKTKARQKFEDFEYLLLFLLGSDARKHQIRIGPDQPDDVNAQLIYCDGTITSSFIADFGRKPYPIQNLKELCSGFWKMTIKTNRSHMETGSSMLLFGLEKPLRMPTEKDLSFNWYSHLKTFFNMIPKSMFVLVLHNNYQNTLGSSLARILKNVGRYTGK